VAKDFRRIAANRLHWYSGLDADCTLRVYQHQRASFERDFVATWRDVMGPAMWALGCMERWGAIASEENVRRYDARLEQEAAAHRAVTVARGLRPDFNPRSPDQMKDLVFGQLALKSKGRPKKTATGNLSLDAETLQGLITDRWGVPFHQATGLPEMDPALLAEKRAADAGLDAIMAVLYLKDALNQRSKYGVDYLKHVGFDGRVHTHYKIARTLRTISEAPNLQNLTSPVGGDLPPEQDPGVQARAVYVPPPGWSILSFDYGQVELRVAAWLAGDEVMAEALEGDFHTATARGIFGRQEVSKGERRIGKEVNFGVAFGQTDFGLSLKLGVSRDTAQGYIDGLLRTYKKFAAWRLARIAEVYRDGQVRSKIGPFLVRRRLPMAGESGESKALDRARKHCENVAINSPIQSTANQICLTSMYRVCRWIKDNPKVPAELNLNVHDALVMYVRRDAVEHVARKVVGIMRGHDLGFVKLKVDVEVGEADYGHLEKLELAA